MKFLELNKKCYAAKIFNDKPADYKDSRTAIETATLVPSANNIQPRKFVAAEGKKTESAEYLPEINKKQVEQVRCVVATFTDTDLAQRSRKIARIGAESLNNDMLGYYMETLLARFAEFDGKRKGEHPALNAGIVVMNLVLALTDQDILPNIILGFDKSSTNDILEIDKRLHPELLIAVGYGNNRPEPSYRLSAGEIIERC